MLLRFFCIYVTAALLTVCGCSKSSVVTGNIARNEVIEAIEAEPLPEESAADEYPRQAGGAVIFVYENLNADQVFIAGDFNNWSTSSKQLEEVEDGLFSIRIPLEPGVYKYKLIVDGDWITDPNNANKAADGYGGENSVIEVK